MPPDSAAARAFAACLGALACLGVQAAPAQAQELPAPEKGEAQDSFYCQERKLGYWFYCTRPKPPEQTAPAAAPNATNQLDAITATLRELKAKAILEPTPANVTAYIRFQREQLDRASLFSDVWQRAIWQDPELDYTLQRPVSTLGKRQWQDSRSAERDAIMAQLSQRYGLFYFFAQSCAACEVMSPIVQGVASRWKITVRAISTDGGPSRHFPGYTVETNQRTRMGLEPKITPAVVLWDALKNQPIPIGYGVMSADELQDRIFLLTSKDAGRDY
jgi:conjugal transfer pilus assembly protein TraF